MEIDLPNDELKVRNCVLSTPNKAEYDLAIEELHKHIYKTIKSLLANPFQCGQPCPPAQNTF